MALQTASAFYFLPKHWQYFIYTYSRLTYVNMVSNIQGRPWWAWSPLYVGYHIQDQPLLFSGFDQPGFTSCYFGLCFDRDSSIASLHSIRNRNMETWVWIVNHAGMFESVLVSNMQTTSFASYFNNIHIDGLWKNICNWNTTPYWMFWCIDPCIYYQPSRKT